MCCSGLAMTLRDDEHAVLADGELTVLGRIRSASNATFLCESTLGLRSLHCVYKPVSGERPLWDFPDGTLAGRELSAYLVSTQLGWNLVPHTIIRDGPAGIGMLQLWVQQPGDAVDSDPLPGPDLVDLFPAHRPRPGYLPVLRAYDYAGDEVVLMHADDIRLRRMAVFDVLINNADRKGGHILCGIDGQVYGSTMDCVCTSRTSCAPCCGVGPASRLTTKFCRRLPGSPMLLAARLPRRWPGESPQPKSARCADARNRCWTNR